MVQMLRSSDVRRASRYFRGAKGDIARAKGDIGGMKNETCKRTSPH